MINVELFNFINHGLQNPFFDYIMPFITHLGGFVSLLAICIIVILLSIVFKKEKIKKIALLCLLSLLIADGIALILKLLVFEPRPFVSLDNVHLLIQEDDPCSFPSGHTTSTFAVLSVLMFKLKNKVLDVVCILFGLTIGFSRIYVGVHYPFDILAGIIIGVSSAYFIYKYEDMICEFFSNMVMKLKSIS